MTHVLRGKGSDELLVRRGQGRGIDLKQPTIGRALDGGLPAADGDQLTVQLPALGVDKLAGKRRWGKKR